MVCFDNMQHPLVSTAGSSRLALALLLCLLPAAALIDRQAVVARHNPIASLPIDPTAVTSLGNGAFAFNIDVTGLQSLNGSYPGLGLNTLSDWGWHTSLSGAEYLRSYNYSAYNTSSGSGAPHQVLYPTGHNGSSAAGAWTHANPHRLPLVQVSLAWAQPGTASALAAAELLSAAATLDAWAGAASSTCTLQCSPQHHSCSGTGAVDVRTSATVHPDVDALAVGLEVAPRTSTSTPLLLKLAFPYASGGAADWSHANDALHTTTLVSAGPGRFEVARTLDSDSYSLVCSYNASWGLSRAVDSPHVLLLSPPPGPAAAAATATDLVCLFYPHNASYPVGAATPWLQGKRAQTLALAAGGGAALPSYAATAAAAAAAWGAYWGAGAFLDLGGALPAAQPAAAELERRVVRSLYLLRALEAGAEPPAETGLLLVGAWAGKHHGEMRYWHQAWAAHWGRGQGFLGRSDAFYSDFLANASSAAAAQGYAGARWPKMTAAVGNRSSGSAGDVPWVGLQYAPLPAAVHGGQVAGLAPLLAWESSSAVGPLLLWQQAHSIFLAEAQRREAAAGGGGAAAAEAVMARLAPVVWATADFLASFSAKNASTGLYHLLPPLYGGEEGGDPVAIHDPAFELVQARTALDTASAWRAALGLPPVGAWEAVRARLAPPPLDPATLNTSFPPLYAANAACACLYLMPGEACPFSRPGCPTARVSHPMTAGLVGMLNGLGGDGGRGSGVAPASANATVAAILGNWSWGSAAASPDVWGWDAPLLALGLARLGWSAQAVAAALLLPFEKNLYNAQGVNQGMGLGTAYLPGNGGTLLAVAALAGGFDGGAPGQQLREGGAGAVASSPTAPVGFPEDWRAVAEGFGVPLP